jgi:RNA polymerase sigma factor (sigma-70 family)
MDEEAFEEIWNAHYADILAFCLRRLGDRQEAADAAADAFLIAWRRSADIPDHARPWLFGVALKVVANRRRGRQRRGALTLRLSGIVRTAPETAVDEPAGDVLAAFRALSEPDQEVLSLVTWEELTPAEAAEVLGIPVARFSVRLHRAKQRLRTRLGAGAPKDNHLITETR